jgi:biuret amidohydrolase
LMVEDCTESYFPEFKQATLEMVRAQGGIVGWTATSQQVLDGFAHWQPMDAAA